MAYTVAVIFCSLLVEPRIEIPIRGQPSSSIDREEFIKSWSFVMPRNDSLKNLKNGGLASIDVPKYNEFCAGAEDGRDEYFASKLDDEDRNGVERDLQDIMIQL
jgi:hypothetical protein